MYGIGKLDTPFFYSLIYIPPTYNTFMYRILIVNYMTKERNSFLFGNEFLGHIHQQKHFLQKYELFLIHQNKFVSL